MKEKEEEEEEMGWMKTKMKQIDTTGRGRLRWSHKSAEVMKDGWSNERRNGKEVIWHD